MPWRLIINGWLTEDTTNIMIDKINQIIRRWKEISLPSKIGIIILSPVILVLSVPIGLLCLLAAAIVHIAHEALYLFTGEVYKKDDY